MHNSISGLLSLILGLAGLFLCTTIWGAIPCVIAIIAGIVSLTDYLAYKWSSIAGIALAIMGLTLLGYQIFENKIVIVPIVKDINVDLTDATQTVIKDMTEDALSNIAKAGFMTTSDSDKDLCKGIDISDPNNYVSNLGDLAVSYDVVCEYLKAALSGNAKEAIKYIDIDYYDNIPRDENFTEEVFAKTISNTASVHNAMILLNKEVKEYGKNGYKLDVTITQAEIGKMKIPTEEGVGYEFNMALYDDNGENMGSERFYMVLVKEANGFRIIYMQDQ